MHRKRHKRSALVCFAIASSFVLAGNRPSCDGDPPTLACDSPAIQVDPGDCVEISNPCGDKQWHRLDGFRLCDGPPGLFVQSQRRPRSRFICAAADATPVADLPVDFFYVTPTDTGAGTFRVTIGSTGVTASATANPFSINPGASSQLDVLASGGTPPYSYSWAPAASLDDANVQSPMASPVGTTTYNVIVTDSAGAQATANLTVTVGLGVQVTATPTAIDVGQSASLAATALGGTPPYSYAWMPVGSLDDATIANPTASPVTTTTYNVVVTDASGATAAGSVTVDVNLEVSASANPTAINAGSQSQLDALVQGGTPPYAYDWAPAASLDDNIAQNPVASPASTTTYNVLVTDAAGNQASTDVTVTVNTANITACFTMNVLAPVAIDVDPSCSSGSIVQYRIWCDYNGLGLPTHTSGSPTVQLCAYETPGPKTVRLEVEDPSGSVAFSEQIFTAE